MSLLLSLVETSTWWIDLLTPSMVLWYRKHCLFIQHLYKERNHEPRLSRTSCIVLQTKQVNNLPIKSRLCVGSEVGVQSLRAWNTSRACILRRTGQCEVSGGSIFAMARCKTNLLKKLKELV